MYSDAQALTLRRSSPPSTITALGEAVIVLGFISYYAPSSYAVPYVIYISWKVLTAITAVFGGIMIFFSGRINMRNLSILAWYFWFCVAVRFASGNGYINLSAFVQGAGFFAFLDYLLQTRSLKTVMKYYLIAGISITLIHFATFLIYMDTPGGMLHGVAKYREGRFIGLNTNNWYFLKHDNGSIFYFIPVIVLLFYYSVYYNRRVIVAFTAYSAFVLFMFYYGMAATAIVASTYLVAVLSWLYFMRKRKRHIPYVLCGYKFTIFAGLVADVIPLLLAGSSAVAGIVAFFGKSTSFSGRDRIWARSMIHFLRNPVSGMGIEEETTTIERIGVNHPHNLVVEILYRGGIIAMILFVLMMIMHSPKKPDRYKAAIFCAGFMSFFITSAFDWYYYYPLPMSMMLFFYYACKEGTPS